VNIAARLEGLADPGGTCVSAQVLDQVRRKLELDFDDLGEQAVKNIPDPIHAYRLRERATGAPLQRERRRPRAVVLSVTAAFAVAAIAIAVYFTMTGRSLAPPGPPLTAIAVLPFDDMSPGGDQAWLANGMADDLIEMLSRVQALQVVARTSARAAKERRTDIRTVGELLNVGSVVEGSIRRSQDQLRVTAQLIRVADGYHLWSGRYERKPDDVFALQEEVAREIAEAIRLELGVQDTWSWLRRSRYSTRDVRAYELVKRAVDSEQTFTEDGFRAEIDLCLKALEIDPDYAQAHSQLAWGYAFLFMFNIVPREENKARAIAAARRALELEPTNGGAHNLLAHMSWDEGDRAGAEAQWVRALEATPGHGPLREGYAHLLLSAGRLEEARVQIQRAIDLDPLNGPSRMRLGDLHRLGGDLDAAIEQYELAAELGWPPAMFVLAHAYHMNGMDEAALVAFVRAMPGAEAGLRRAFDQGRYDGMVQAALDRLVSLTGESCPNFAARLLAILGDADRLFGCLDRWIEQHRPARFLKVDPVYASYRDDPRFTALLRRMGLEE
jgi:TolB-like protein/Flp pilus assembly protein TadD